MLKSLPDLSKKTGQHPNFKVISTLSQKFTREAHRLHRNHPCSGCFNTDRRKKKKKPQTNNPVIFHSKGELNRGCSNRPCLKNSAGTPPLPRGPARAAPRLTPLTERTGTPGSCQPPPPARYHSEALSAPHAPLQLSPPSPKNRHGSSQDLFLFLKETLIPQSPAPLRPGRTPLRPRSSPGEATGRHPSLLLLLLPRLPPRPQAVPCPPSQPHSSLTSLGLFRLSSSATRPLRFGFILPELRGSSPPPAPGAA